MLSPKNPLNRSNFFTFCRLIKNVFGKTLDREHKLKNHDIILDTNVIIMAQIHQSRNDSLASIQVSFWNVFRGRQAGFLCSGAKGPLKS